MFALHWVRSLLSRDELAFSVLSCAASVVALAAALLASLLAAVSCFVQVVFWVLQVLNLPDTAASCCWHSGSVEGAACRASCNVPTFPSSRVRVSLPAAGTVASKWQGMAW